MRVRKVNNMGETAKKVFLFITIGITSIIMFICCILTTQYSRNYYRISYKLEAEIIDATLKYIGDSYNDEVCLEDETYYQLDIVAKNNTNEMLQSYSSSYQYETDYGYVNKNRDSGMISSADTYLIPPDAESSVKVILKIPKEATELYISIWNDDSKKIIVPING